MFCRQFKFNDGLSLKIKHQVYHKIPERSSTCLLNNIVQMQQLIWTYYKSRSTKSKSPISILDKINEQKCSPLLLFPCSRYQECNLHCCHRCWWHCSLRKMASSKYGLLLLDLQNLGKNQGSGSEFAHFQSIQSLFLPSEVSGCPQHWIVLYCSLFAEMNHW